MVLSLYFKNLKVSKEIWRNLPDHIINEINDPSTVKPRTALQALGDIIREKDLYALLKYAAKISNGSSRIIEDVRFEFEALYFDQIGYSGIRVYADENIRLERLIKRDGFIKKSNLNHTTETSIQKIQTGFKIDNTSTTIEELADKVKEVIQGI